MHPLALAARLDDPCAAQVGQVAGDFGLWLIEYFDEVADAKLPVAHQVEQAQAGGVFQGLEEALQVAARRVGAWRVFCHGLLIRLDEYVGKPYSCISRYVFGDNRMAEQVLSRYGRSTVRWRRARCRARTRE